jgi:molybdopterin synthase sulfur carrier subunit
MKTINVLAFGVAKEIVGGPSVEVAFLHAMNATELKDLLEKRFPRLRDLSSFMIAVNDELASPESPIFYGDEVAIIPPVSGG